MKIKQFDGGSPFEEKIGYSRAVTDGAYVHVAGTTGYDYQTMQIADSAAAQARQCFINLDKALRAAGSSLERVVRVRYIFPNRDDAAACFPVFREYLGKARPAATLIVAGLLDDKMKLEIEVTAAINDDNMPTTGD